MDRIAESRFMICNNEDLPLYPIRTDIRSQSWYDYKWDDDGAFVIPGSIRYKTTTTSRTSHMVEDST